jgi:hypothetical protein
MKIFKPLVDELFSPKLTEFQFTIYVGEILLQVIQVLEKGDPA